MCAARTPQQGLEVALSIQTALHEHDWGTDALDAIYHGLEDADEGDVGQLAHAGDFVRRKGNPPPRGVSRQPALLFPSSSQLGCEPLLLRVC